MADLQDVVLPPGGAIALAVGVGQRLRIYQVEGQQVADLVSFMVDDPTNRLSMFTSRILAGSWRLSVGSVLASTGADDLWRIEVDSVAGEHYTGGGYCNPGINQRRFGESTSPTCAANFDRVLKPYGLASDTIDGDVCFNAFMRVDYQPDGGFVFRESRSRAGDELVLCALADQIVGISNCPQTRGAANAGSIKPLGVELRGAQSR